MYETRAQDASIDATVTVIDRLRRPLIALRTTVKALGNGLATLVPLHCAPRRGFSGAQAAVRHGTRIMHQSCEPRLYYLCS